MGGCDEGDVTGVGCGEEDVAGEGCGEEDVTGGGCGEEDVIGGEGCSEEDVTGGGCGKEDVNVIAVTTFDRIYIEMTACSAILNLLSLSVQMKPCSAERANLGYD